MARTMIAATSRRATDLTVSNGLTSRNALQRVLTWFQGFAQGAYPGCSDFQYSQTQATGTLTLSGASGVVGGSVNGSTAVTVTAAGGDVATATALVAAFNASTDPLVNQHVTASNLDATGAATAVVTLMGYTPGAPGNAVTLAATGTGVTASGPRLTGGVTNSYRF